MAEQPKSSSKKSPLIYVVIAAVMLAGGLGTGWFLFARNKTTQAAGQKVVEKKEPEFTLHLESFTVNLNDVEENHFLRCTIDLSLEHAPKGAGKEGADAAAGLPIPRIRDTILSVLTSAKANELLTPQGKLALKQNILSALKERTPEIEAQEVYFTEFLVQR
jgi:flagellar basal body-associated protein FliL